MRRVHRKTLGRCVTLIVALVTVLLMALPCTAQASGRLFLYNSGDAVFLRGVEARGDLPEGCHVYRRAEGTSDWIRLTSEPLRPILEADNLRHLAGLRAEILISMLGGGEGTRRLSKGDFDRVLLDPQTRNFFLGMTLAIQGLGRALGQEYVDTQIEPGASFEYRMTALRDGREDEIAQAGPLTHGEAAEIPVPVDLVGEADDGAAMLDWSRAKEREIAHGIVGYNVYQAVGDVTQPFVRVNTTPVMDIRLTTGADDAHAFRTSDLQNGTRYWFRITAVNTFGFESDPSEAVIVTPRDQQAPPEVANLVARTSPQAVLLTWESVRSDDLRGYELFRSSGDIEAFGRIAPLAGRTLATAAHVDTAVAPGAVYWYRVRAVDRDGNAGPFSNAVQVYQRDLIPPPRVAELIADASQGGRVVLSWSAVDDPTFDDYTLERSLTPETEDEFWFRITDHLDATTFTDSLWEAQQGEVSYRVAANDLSGNRGDWSQIVTVRPPDRVPPPPPLLRSIAVDGDTIRLGWNPSIAPDVAGYTIWRSRDKTGGYQQVTPVALPPDRTTYAERPGATSITYWYRGQAIDTDGNASQLSDPLGIPFRDRVAPPPPGEFEVRSTPAGVQLSWREPRAADLRGYNIYRRLADEAEIFMLDQMPMRGTGFLDYTAEAGEAYVYEICAFDQRYNIGQPAGPLTITFEPEEEQQ